MPDNMTHGYGRLVLGAVLLAFVIRLGAVFAYQAHVSPELWEIEEIVNNLLSGRGFVYHHFGTDYRSWVEPLYPMLTYVVYALSHHSYLAMALVNVLLSTALVPVASSVARLTFGPAAGVWAGYLVAIDPGLIRYAAKFHPLVLDAVLMALVVLAFIRARLVPVTFSYVVVGITIGFCLLTRPSVLVFVPIGLVWLLVRSTGTLARRVLAVCFCLAVAAAIVSPWVIRNYMVHERFVLTRTNGWFVFWLGNHRGWSGSATNQSGDSLFLAAAPELRERVLRADELRQNNLFLQEAMSFVGQDPAGFFGRTAMKFLYFWWFSPQSGLQYRSEPFWIYQLFYIVAAVLAAIGLLCAFLGRLESPDRAAWPLLLAFLLSISLFQSLFYVEGRHRLGVEAVFLVFTANGIVNLLRRVRGTMAVPRLAKASDTHVGSRLDVGADAGLQEPERIRGR